MLYNPEQVLLGFQFKLRSLIFFVLETAIAARQTLKTPYTAAQLTQEYTTIKEFLKQRLKNSPSATDPALKQVVKGRQMAIHKVTLLTSKIKYLQAIKVCQKHK